MDPLGTSVEKDVTSQKSTAVGSIQVTSAVVHELVAVTSTSEQPVIVGGIVSPTHSSGISRTHVAEHPSPEILLPSSQLSPMSRTPSPQREATLVLTGIVLASAAKKMLSSRLGLSVVTVIDVSPTERNGLRV